MRCAVGVIYTLDFEDFVQKSIKSIINNFKNTYVLETIIFWTYKQNISLKLIHLFFNAATKNLKMTCVTHITFLFDC